MEGIVRGEMNWRKEAELALRDVRFAVDHCWVSEKLPSTRDCAFFNLTTVEGQEFCVRLSWRGFEVVGRCHDDKSEEEGAVWETVYALLSHVSPSYTALFGHQLAEHLSKIEPPRDGSDDSS